VDLTFVQVWMNPNFLFQSFLVFSSFSTSSFLKEQNYQRNINLAKREQRGKLPAVETILVEDG